MLRESSHYTFNCLVSILNKSKCNFVRPQYQEASGRYGESASTVPEELFCELDSFVDAFVAAKRDLESARRREGEEARRRGELEVRRSSTGSYFMKKGKCNKATKLWYSSWYQDKIPPEKIPSEKIPPEKIPLNAVDREPIPTRVLNPNANEASFKPKQLSFRKMKLDKK